MEMHFFCASRCVCCCLHVNACVCVLLLLLLFGYCVNDHCAWSSDVMFLLFFRACFHLLWFCHYEVLVFPCNVATLVVFDHK